MKNLSFSGSLLIPIIFCSANVVGQSLDSGARPEFDLQVYLESIYDDNAFRTATDRIGERQDRLGLDIAGEYDSGLNDWRFSYLVERQSFQKDSQDSVTNAIGEARYELGDDTTWYSFEAAHVVDQVLQSPDSDVTTSTIGDQQLLELRPSIRTRPDRPTSIYLTGIYRKVEYEVADRPDATDRGGEVGLVRLLSPRAQLGASFTQSDISIDDPGVDDFRNETASIYYSGESRKLDYRIEGGYQRLESLDSDFEDSAITYGLRLEYEHQGSTIVSTLSKSLTNTAFAQSVSDGATGAVVVAEGDADDIIEALDAQMRWSTRSVCGRCQLGLELQYQDVNYNKQDALDFEIVSGAFIFDYRLSSLTTFATNLSYRKTDFPDDPSRTADSRVVDLGYVRNFSETFNVSAMYSWSDQRATIVDYDSNRFGIRLTKTFY